MDCGFPSSWDASDPAPPEERDTDTYRAWTLTAPASLTGPLVWTAKDEEVLLRRVVSKSDPKLSLEHVSTFSVRIFGASQKKNRGACAVVVVGLVPQPDATLFQGGGWDSRLGASAQHLAAAGFVTQSGAKLVLTQDAASDGLQYARICRIHTRASNADVTQAFIDRGVASDHIMRVSAATVGSTGVPARTKLVHLTPGYPISKIPWKVALEEPRAPLSPYKVTVDGSHCHICRAGEHQFKQCPKRKPDQCGRCGWPFADLKRQGKSELNHDCEGGAGGYGAHHADYSGDQWHRVWLEFKAQQAPADAEVADPAEQVRAESLAAAQNAAKAAMEAMNARKQARAQAAQSGDTPPAKRLQTNTSAPDNALPPPVVE